MTIRIPAGLAPLVLLAVLAAGCASKKVAVATPSPASTPTARAPETTSTPRPAAAPQAPARQTPSAQIATSRTPSPETKARIQDLLDRIQDAYFDYNSNNLRPDAEAALRSDALTLSRILQDYPDYKLTIEGYCDERGSDQYNLALGDARARRAKSYLTDAGVPDRQIRTVSYGKERPVCTDENETCWQKNRRVHINQGN